MLEAINITKRYDRSVLDSLSFAVQPGEIVGVVGKSATATCAAGNRHDFSKLQSATQSNRF